MTECRLYLADLVLEIASGRPLAADPTVRNFMTGGEGKHPVSVRVDWDFSHAPKLPQQPAGTTGIQTYYRRDGQNFCVLRESWKGILSIAQYDDTFTAFHCWVNPAPFEAVPQSVGFCMRMLPVRALLQHYGISFFHAAQIAVGERGILFTAPSGTGKTTQAKLWQKERGARILCNDRTLVRNSSTWGFPLDGSEPIGSPERCALGAIVVLAQSPENRVTRLRPSRALQQLLPQMVLDAWDGTAREIAAQQLLSLLGQTPVYLLECTKDAQAVSCLEQALRKDGVI